MGKHVFSLNLKVEIESPQIENGESGRALTVSPDILFHTISGLRSETLSDIDILSAQEFEEATRKATEINGILSELEGLESFTDDSDDDEEGQEA